MARQGFSLIELTAVILILGIAAAAVALNIHAPVRAAAMKDAVEQVRQFDGLTRVYCRQHDRAVVMEIASDGKRLRRLDRQGNRVGGVSELPNGIAVVRVLTGGVECTDARIVCSRQGFTPSYALLLEGPGGRSQWLVVAGLTGEVTEVGDGKEVVEILPAGAAGEGDDAR